ncbi:methyl-accepting chemotaxis protein [Tardiphaga sp. 839_C3_N1_4]|jgi:methyl-accepting chemotaxis protein|uniref:methyl-accepting chemotaxis protein n=1 Tax=Tardiphaga sp. 839_C3_N1_4 TaxID=3240761 RepID=UPI003F1FC3BF
MLNHLSVSKLLQSVILVMAGCVVIVLAADAWDSWGRLRAANRISLIADASGHVFKAMHNLRAERAAAFRSLSADAAVAPDYAKYIRSLRDAEVPAMRTAADLLVRADFDGKDTLLPEFNRLMQSLISLQAESWDAMAKPKAERRAGLAKEYDTNNEALLPKLEGISTALAAAVNHSDAAVDQLLMIKQMAWQLRVASGDASTMVSSALAVGKIAPEAAKNYAKYVGRIESAWNGLEAATSGTKLSPELTATLDASKKALFDPDYLTMRDALVAALAAGEKPAMTSTNWSPFSVDRMGTAVTVAERALDEAKTQTLIQISVAERSLIVQLILLTMAVVLAIGGMLLVSRRVITPLHTIRDAMLQVAGGDLAVEAVYSDRQDEIGALAGALETFKRQAMEKAAIERQEHTRNADAANRQQAVERHIATFEFQMQDALTALASASEQMNTTSDGMQTVSSRTNARIQVAAQASGEASMNVQNVASASEELSASINDISRQATHAAGIANRAVSQARQTDTTVQGLATTANRIGEVVGLISDIASQTNLLALNATIEAARAGEAGRGFAVVASEVKSLASQTAKATDDISEQIADIQKVANEAIQAIQGIGGVIAEVNEVATAIAAAVEEQGAATLEITRSTQQAATGTKNVSENISGVRTDADATGAAAQDVKTASETLSEQTRKLGAQVTDFLGKIRAA